MKDSLLKDLIIKRIYEKGPILFADFMDMVLYCPELGYYTKKRDSAIIPDYYTSSDLHPVFGKAISAQISRMADVLKDEKFTVIEIGAGKGALANDILNGLKIMDKSLYDRLDFIIIEKNESLLLAVSKILTEHKPKISFASSLKELEMPQVAGCILSNELIDSFPVHRITKIDGSLNEVYVSLNGERFIEEFGAISQSEIEEYINRYKIEFTKSSRIEVNLKVSDLMQELSGILRKGFIITIDYGYLADKLYSGSFPDGTLRCYKKHRLSDNPYMDIGEKDITSSVNFSELIYQGALNGFELTDFITQREFLLKWGVLDFISEFAVEKRNFTAKKFSELEAIKNLLLPDGMGEIFKVLIQQKGIIGDKIKLGM